MTMMMQNMIMRDGWSLSISFKGSGYQLEMAKMFGNLPAVVTIPIQGNPTDLTDHDVVRGLQRFICFYNISEQALKRANEYYGRSTARFHYLLPYKEAVEILDSVSRLKDALQGFVNIV